MTLAVLAIALKIVIPAGFMAGHPTGKLPFALVLCTGQGAMVVAPGEGPPHPGDRDKSPAGGAHDSPCVFAGHGVTAPPPSVAAAEAVAFVVHNYRPDRPTADLAPGRGLTGPPLPARGPPALLT